MFAAGADYFGVSDLSSFADDTHKFESRYLDWLVGPGTRAPIDHVDNLRAPVIVLQGLEDQVVPPSSPRSWSRRSRARASSTPT